MIANSTSYNKNYVWPGSCKFELSLHSDYTISKFWLTAAYSYTYYQAYYAQGSLLYSLNLSESARELCSVFNPVCKILI